MSITSADVMVASLTVSRPMTVDSGRTLTVTTATLNAAVTVNGTLAGGTYAINAGGNLVPTSCSSRLSNMTINGDVTNFTGNVRWNNVTLNGTWTMKGGASIAFEGNQTLTGTIVGDAAGSGAYLSQYNNALGTVTIASGAAVRGAGVQFVDRRSCIVGSSALLNVVNNGTIEGTNASSPVLLRVPVVGGTGNATGPVDFRRSVSDSVLTLAANAAGSPQFGTSSCGNRLSNTTINGNVTMFAGSIRWNNVTLNGTWTMITGSTIAFEGNQTLTGTIVGDAVTSGASLSQYNNALGTLTIASGAAVRGAGIRFVDARNGCRMGSSARLVVVNDGTIEGTSGGSPIEVQVPLLNFGSITGFVNSTGGTFGVPFSTATPTQTAIASTPRADPGPASTQTLAFQNLYVTPGTPFWLGSGETLNLDNGQGTLYISPGATFTSNGLINANVYNAGLLIIPITRVEVILNVTGPGTVRIVPPAVLPPPGTPVIISPPAPPVVRPGLLVSVGQSVVVGGGGGGGGGGGEGGGGGYYQISTPQLTVQGGVVWDGKLEVTGSFTQSSTGVVRLFIAGPAQGETYSQLAVGLGASLEGGVQIVLQPDLFDYLPAVGTTFDMVVAQGGITLPSGGLNVRTLMTAAGAQRLGLSLPAFSSGFAGDPNSLVVWPEDAFTYSLVDGGTTLRFTLVRPICGSAPTLSDVYLCPNSVGTFTASPIGFGPFTYQWYVENPQDPGEYIPVVDGVMPGIATFGGAASSTLSASDPALIRTRLYCVVSSSCGDQATNSATLIIASKCSPADVANTDGDTTLTGSCPDGVLDNGDFTAFFAGFFGDPADPLRIVADIANTDGETVNEGAGPDGAVDNGDFTAFFFYFFAGCE